MKIPGSGSWAHFLIKKRRIHKNEANLCPRTLLDRTARRLQTVTTDALRHKCRPRCHGAAISVRARVGSAARPPPHLGHSAATHGTHSTSHKGAETLPRKLSPAHLTPTRLMSPVGGSMYIDAPHPRTRSTCVSIRPRAGMSIRNHRHHGAYAPPTTRTLLRVIIQPSLAPPLLASNSSWSPQAVYRCATPCVRVHLPLPRVPPVLHVSCRRVEC